MPTITTVDATWTNGVAMDEAELRRADSAMFLGDGSNNGVRGGIVRHGTNSLAVSINGSDQVTVQAGVVVIPAATGLGVYRASLSAATSAVAIDPRNATNPRIDLVVFRSTGAVDIITGTPGASPSAPALPANAVELGRINVPATGGGAAVADLSWKTYAAALGGTLYVATPARLPASGNLPRQRAVALSDGTEHVWNGATSVWVPTGGTVSVTSGTDVDASLTVGHRISRNAILYSVSATANIDFSPGARLFFLPSGAYPPSVVFGDLVNGSIEAPIRVRARPEGDVTAEVAILSGTTLRGQILVPF